MESSFILSIIIPYFNADVWIGKMLDSLIDQDLSADSYEVIVIDDGSTQDSTNLIHYTEQYPDLIKCYRKKNGGMSDARNIGIELAKGKYLYFCDSDDFVQPKVIGSLIKKAEELDLEMLVCNWSFVQPNAAIREQTIPYFVSEIKTGREYLSSFSTDPMSIGFGVWRYFIKKNILTDYGIRFEDIRLMEDRVFQLDLLMVVDRVAHADINLYYYVQHKSSTTHDPKKKQFKTFATYIWHYIDRLSVVISNDSSSLDDDALTVLDGWRDMAVFSLLIGCFRYSPVSETKQYLKALSSINGAYPLMVKGPRKYIRWTRYCMGHKGLWLFMCRVFHILPLRVRLSM